MVAVSTEVVLNGPTWRPARVEVPPEGHATLPARLARTPSPYGTGEASAAVVTALRTRYLAESLALA
ncbi:hypothetical protein ACIBCA_10065 [Kitasatospora sp. NPDC051170]|uniref:hypothetical protein n=1 Tax=Kitasatospora sp. NPDC051170 TaxID=3364056 RepID=UPI0037B30F1E